MAATLTDTRGCRVRHGMISAWTWVAIVTWMVLALSAATALALIPGYAGLGTVWVCLAAALGWGIVLTAMLVLTKDLRS